MKYILFLILFSVRLYSQNDSAIHKTNFIKNSDSKVWLISGSIMAIPSTGMLFLSDDKTSKGIFGTLSITGNLALIIGATKTFHEDHKLRNKFMHYSFMSLGGVCDAISEELLHHYSLVKEKFPNIKDKFFNPEISWHNKYKNGDEKQGDAFFGSSTVFVGVTDAFHFSRSIKQTMWLGGLITFQKGKNFKQTVLQALISIAVYTTAKGTTHYILSH